MNRFLLVFLLFLFQCNFASLLLAETEVRVGIYDNEPLIFVDNEGKGKGIFADIIEYVGQKEGWRIEYVPGKWQESLDRLQNNQIDILCTIAYSTKRDQLYDFSGENLLTNWGQLYTPIGSEIKAITDLGGKRIAVLKGDIYRSGFVNLIEKFGVDCVLIEMDDYHAILRMVSEGQADAGVVNRFFGMKFGTTYKIDRSGVIFSPIEIHFAVPEGKNDAYITAIDRHIKSLKAEEESVYYKSLDRWFGVLPERRTLPQWFWWALTATLGVVILLFLGNLLLRNRVKAKTKELTLELNRRRQTEKALQHAYNIINSSPAVAFLWQNMKGWPVEFVSDNVEGLFGYTVEQFISGEVSYESLVHPNDLERVGEEVAIASIGNAYTNVPHKPYRIISKDGDIRWLDDRTYIRRDDSGNITHFEGIVVDITASVLAAEALKENKKKLARSKKMESLGLLAGGVAHDLNNVLSGIVSYPDLLLLDLPEGSPFRDTVEAIKESGNRAVAIVQDLLTVARGVATSKEPLNISTLINDYLHSPECKKLKHFHPDVIIKSDLDGELFNIRGSNVHIRKVIMNLVSNGSEAVKGSGTVSIMTSNRYVDRPFGGFEDVREGEYVVLTVADEGEGISPEELERIFEPFYTKKVMGRSGTGLGLAVVWNVVQDHNGYIDVASSEDGTRFDVYFPITREEIPADELSVSFEELKGDGQNILVVDDVKGQRDISMKMLELFNYSPAAVGSGEEAIEYLKERRVDLVVLDMIMDPGMNGRKTYEKILEIHPDQKAIIVSGFAETDEVKGAQQLGAGAFIKKPLTLETFGLAVKQELAS